MRAVHDLIERPVSFDYGYKMTCANCGGITALTSADYHRERNGAHVKCVNCESDIHFGPAVMAPRNADDPVLDDQIARTVAWYHTSTDPNWPDSGHPMPPSAVELLARVMPDDEVHRTRDHYESQALHLGTYEAAIESMLRRMRDQDDGDAQFCLYRIVLCRDNMTIEPGWRDENSAGAANITLADLGDSDAIRYLNVHESPGSISLAIRRESIAAVQRVPLPVRALKVSASRSLVSEVSRIRFRIGQIEAARTAELDSLERIQRRTAARRGVPFERSPTPAQHELLEHISKLIEDEYLEGVSAPVRAKFADALRAWRRAQDAAVDDVSYIGQFALMATALTLPGDILRALDGQTVRKL
jgi:hypothetical protein